MKKCNFLKFMMLLGLVFFIQSCEKGFEDPIEDGFVKNNSWQATTKLLITPVVKKESFVWAKNVATLQEYWQNDEVALNVKIVSPLAISKIQKVDFYISAAEKDGYNSKAPYDETSILAATASTFNADGTFTVKFKAQDIYAKFASKFSADRTVKVAKAGDTFELHWVITGQGKVLDSRESLEPDSRFGFQTKLVDVAPDVWSGTFDIKWTYASPAISYAVKPGDVGVMNVTQVSGSEYNVDNLRPKAPYFSGAGKIYYNYITGLLSTTDADQTTWKITSVNGSTLSIDWTYKYTASYGEYGSFTVTRRDGQNWPANIHTN